MNRNRRSHIPDRLTICSAGDEKYATGLRVALFSALETAREPANIVVLDGGLRDPSVWRRMVGAHPHCAHCEVVSPDLRVFASYPNHERFPPAAWIRLLLPDLMPDTRRLIYIDSDAMVRTDLGALWRATITGPAIAAVRDFINPTFATGLPHAVSALGVPAETPYYNTGVLVLDLEAWRRDALSQRAVDYVRDHGKTIRFADQDALNAVAVGRVVELPPRWNVQVGAFAMPALIERDERTGGVLADVEALKASAAIVHFTVVKPWQPESIRAQRWSVVMHIEFARIAARFTDDSRLQQIMSASRWSTAMMRRFVHAISNRLNARGHRSC